VFSEMRWALIAGVTAEATFAPGAVVAERLRETGGRAAT